MFALQARGLRKTYGEGDAAVEALRGVSMDVPRGEFLSIMGPSGSGKSTLMHLLGLLDAPSDGRLRLMGQTASRLDDKGRTLARRRHLGFVFQAFYLIPRATTMQNVMLPMAFAGLPRRERRGRASAALEAVGLADRLHFRPNELSGGQKQRVAIARALALDPPIILADEPTGNLDSVTSHEIMELFRHLNAQGRTIIQVTHDPRMAHHGDRIIHLRDGVIEKEGRRTAGAGTQDVVRRAA